MPSCRPRPSCCAPACCSPVIIRTCPPPQQSQRVSMQVCCDVPPPPRPRVPPKTCCIPITICEDGSVSAGRGGGCCEQSSGGCVVQSCGTTCGPQKSTYPCPCPQTPGCCVPPCPACPCPQPLSGDSCGKGVRFRREQRWPQCNFLKPCIDTRIYRDGEHMSISFAGHIPGEQFIHGRNLPTTTTFAKRRLCTFTPYEFVDPDGCCSFP